MFMHVPELIKQKSYERVVYMLRRHPITFLPTVILFIINLFVPFLVYRLIFGLFPTIQNSPIATPLAMLFLSAYALGGIVLFFSFFIDYYLDLWIVTNDRIVDIEQFGLFARTISELDLYQIQDVTTEIHGILATIFQYGNVAVKTASSNTGIIFRNVPRPNHVREMLIKLSDEDRKHHGLAPLAGAPPLTTTAPQK